MWNSGILLRCFHLWLCGKASRGISLKVPTQMGHFTVWALSARQTDLFDGNPVTCSVPLEGQEELEQSPEIKFAACCRLYGALKRGWRWFRTLTREIGSVRIPQGAQIPRLQLRVRPRDCSAPLLNTWEKKWQQERPISLWDGFIKHNWSLPQKAETPPPTR